MSSVCKCGSDRILEVSGKCSDRCCYRTAGGKWVNGYVPMNKGLGDSEDYISVEFCMDCGQMQGQFPLPNRSAKKVAG